MIEALQALNLIVGCGALAFLVRLESRLTRLETIAEIFTREHERNRAR